MKNRVAVVLLVLAAMLVWAPRHAPAQEATSEGSRKIVTRVPPQYPGIARTMHIQGAVKADVLVAPNGTAKSIEVIGGHPVLAEAAQNALRQWKWEPAAHESHEIIELKFKF
jgi:TonB family protein